MDLADLHALITLDFIGDIAFGNDLQALTKGTGSRILQLLEIILPELMKCGLFPLRKTFPVLKQTRDMFRAITEIREMGDKAVGDARRNVDQEKTDNAGKFQKIFEILAL